MEYYCKKLSRAYLLQFFTLGNSIDIRGPRES